MTHLPKTAFQGLALSRMTHDRIANHSGWGAVLPEIIFASANLS